MAPIQNPMVKITFSSYGYKSLYEEIINSTEVDISNCIDSDFGAEIKYTREGLSSVVIETSFPQTFYKSAYSILRDLYDKYGLHAHCKVNIYRRDNIDVLLYHHVKTMGVDFSTAIIKNNSIEVELTTISLNKYIKSGGRTKYDFKVNDLSPEVFKYDRIILDHIVNYSPVPPSGLNFTYDRTYYNVISTQLGDFVGSKNQLKHEFKSEVYSRTQSFDDLKNADYIFKAGGDVTLRFYADMTFLLKKGITTRSPSVSFKLGVKHYEGGYIKSVQTYYDFPLNDNWELVVRSDGYLSVTLEKDDELFILIEASANDLLPGTGDYLRFDVLEFNSFYFQYQNKGEDVYIDVLKPLTVLNKLINNITNSTQFNGYIEWKGDDLNYSCMLCAAESIRGFKDAYLHTSFEDFVKWMDVLGYGYEFTNDYSLTFKKYEDFFSGDTTLYLSEKENADLIIQPDNDFAYTRIRVGMEKEEYDDNVNGRLEVAGVFEYHSGYLSENENKLELITPYRFDAVGIELLCWERPDQGKNNSDNKSDNDVFFIALKPDTITDSDGNTIQGYLLYDDIKYFIYDIERYYLFNAVFSPYHLTQRNSKRIGINSSKIQFASTTSNRSAIILGESVKLYDDILTPIGFFKPKTYNIACGYKTNLPIIEIPNGIVEFTYMRKAYKGFIKEATKNYSRNTETTITLLAIE